MHYYQPHTSSKQWLNCPPSAKLCAEVDDRSSAYAQQGTDAHTLCEYKVLLATGKKATWDPTEHLTYYDAEMENCAEEYSQYVLEEYLKAKELCPDPEILVEQRLDFSKWVPKGFGTGDCIYSSTPYSSIISKVM